MGVNKIINGNCLGHRIADMPAGLKLEIDVAALALYFLHMLLESFGNLIVTSDLSFAKFEFDNNLIDNRRLKFISYGQSSLLTCPGSDDKKNS